MISASNFTPARPPFAIRVGITGARSLRAEQLPRLRTQLRTLLADVKEQMQRLAADRAASAGYAHDDATSQYPILRVLSPLARGSDRLVAEEALALGYQLHVPMPFPQRDYEEDFTGCEDDWEPPLSAVEDITQFRALLARAGTAWFALDGDRGADINRAYQAVGRFVVRHCDLLIAIWDGMSDRGLGGTADIVRYAADGGPAICWLHASQDLPPRWLDSAEALRLRDRAPGVAEPLRRYLQRIVLPPAQPRHYGTQHATPFDYLTRVLDRTFAFARRAAGSVFPSMGRDPPWRAPWVIFFYETRQKDRWLWRFFAWMVSAAARERLLGKSSPSPWPSPKNERAPGLWWHAHYIPSDELATAYADRYRSVYVLVFGLAWVALTLAAISQSLAAPVCVPGRMRLAAAALELLALFGIFLLVLENQRRHWHERSIEYRLLAELCRKQQALAPIGWSLSATAKETEATATGRAGRLRYDIAPHDRAVWVAWLFAALQRAGPLPQGTIGPETLRAARAAAVRELLDNQILYHRRRRRRMHRASLMLTCLGEFSFFLVFLVVLLEIWASTHQWDHCWVHLFGLLAIVLPGLSAASIGIRAYSEMPLLAAQSRRMCRDLALSRARLCRLDLSRAMASQDLGAGVARVATLMLQDLEGWAQLFQVKVVEAG
ncbi:MAG TPA: hypothetical protein VMA53_08095 [Stellaceae bacterium]|nr:hypothetical protein [Stellaceae bacterium]